MKVSQTTGIFNRATTAIIWKEAGLLQGVALTIPVIDPDDHLVMDSLRVIRIDDDNVDEVVAIVGLEVEGGSALIAGLVAVRVIIRIGVGFAVKEKIERGVERSHG